MGKDRSHGCTRRVLLAALACTAVVPLTACGTSEPATNLAVQDAEPGAVVNFFSPMEKRNVDAKNTARTASDLTIAMAEEQTGATVAYHTYTAETYKDKTYDEVCLERIRHG